MTSDRPTLLEALAWGRVFGRRKEDVAVEALGHILSTSETARAALSDVVDADGKPVGPIHSVQTQVRSQDGARPDLACYDESGRKRILIEAKFLAGLTKYQPVAYLKELPGDQPSALLFVAPAPRVEWLWTELRSRMSKRHRHARLLNGVRSAPADGARRLMLTSWRHLIERMEARVAAGADSQADADIRQLRGMATHKDEFPPLRREELRLEFPRRMLALRRLVDDAAKCALDAGWADAKGLKVAPQRWGYGRFLRLADAQVWFGIDFDSWVLHPPDTPLWLWFTRRSLQRRTTTLDALEPLGGKDPREIFPDGSGGLVAPVALPLDVGYEAVAEAVVERLKEIARLLGRRRFGKPARSSFLPPEEFSPLRNADMYPDFPRRMLWLQRLVDDATARSVDAGWADTKKLMVKPQPRGYGRYLRLAETAAPWFGVDFRSWAHLSPATPLWLWFKPSSLKKRKTARAIERLRRKNPPELFDDHKEGLVIPVPLPVEKEYPAVLDGVVDRLQEVTQLIGRTSVLDVVFRLAQQIGGASRR